MALWRLIGKISPIVDCFWGHWSEGSVLLECVILAADNHVFF